MNIETVTSIPTEVTEDAMSQMHQDFKPVRDLQLSDLPKGWKCPDVLDVISHVAQRVVMIYIPRMSSERPTSIFSECPHFGGTGFAYYVDQRTVKVRTNLHVIYNAEEAAMATVQFSLHVPGKRHVRVINMQASADHFYNNLCEDYSSFTCFTNSRLRKYLNLFCDVPVLWDASFFLNNSDSSTSSSDDDDRDIDDMEVDNCLDPSFSHSLKRMQEGGSHCSVKQISLQKYPCEMAPWGNYSCETFLEGEHHQAPIGMSDSLIMECDMPEALDTSGLLETGTGEESVHHPGFADMGYVHAVDGSSAPLGHCRRPTLENGDYVAILSHPLGQEKCFSLGLAAMYDAETLEKQQNNFRNLNRISRIHRQSHAGHPAVHLINDRFKICKNRIYHTQSTFGCSGAPVLLFKRSLQRMKIPVVDYSQHSGTCFFRNGEKLGFATCFTPPVFAQSAWAYEDLQQCYSVIRKQEQMLRHEGQLQSQRFQQPDCAVESTHIVNTDSAPGTLSYCYRMEKGTIIRRKVLLREDMSAIPSITSPLGKVMSYSHLRLPAHLQTVIPKSSTEYQGRTQVTNKSDFLPRKTSFNHDKMCLLKSTCDVNTLEDFLSLEQMRSTDERDISKMDDSSCRNNVKDISNRSSHKTSHSKQQSIYTLEGGFGYRIYRKKLRVAQLSVQWGKKKIMQKLQALKIKTKQKLGVCSDSQKRNPLPETGSQPFPCPNPANENTHKQDLPTQDGDFNLKPFTDSSVKHNSLDTTSFTSSEEFSDYDYSLVKVENQNSDTSSTSSEKSPDNAYYPVKYLDFRLYPGLIPDSDGHVCKFFHKAATGTQTENNTGSSRHVEPPDENSVCITEKHEDERSFHTEVTDFNSTSKQDAPCSTVGAGITQTGYPFDHAFSECLEFSRGPLCFYNSCPTVSSAVNSTTQNLKAVNFSDEPQHLGGVAGEVKTIPFFNLPDFHWKLPSQSLSNHDNHGCGVADHSVTDGRKTQLASKDATEYMRPILPLSSNKISSKLSSIIEKNLDDDHEGWNKNLEYNLFSDFMGTDDLLEPSSSYNISDHPEILSNNLKPYENTEECTEGWFSKTNQDTPENILSQKSVFNSMTFMPSPAEHFVNCCDKTPPLFKQALTSDCGDHIEKHQHLDDDSVLGGGYKENEVMLDTVLEEYCNDSSDASSSEEKTAYFTTQTMNEPSALSAGNDTQPLKSYTQPLKSYMNLQRENHESTIHVDRSQIWSLLKSDFLYLQSVACSPASHRTDVEGMADSNRDQPSTPSMETSLEPSSDDLPQRQSLSPSVADLGVFEHYDEDESEHRQVDISEHRDRDDFERSDGHSSEYYDVDVSEHSDGDESKHNDEYISECSNTDDHEHTDGDESTPFDVHTSESSDAYISESSDAYISEYSDVYISEHNDTDISEHNDTDDAECNDVDVSEHKAGNELEHTDVYISEHNDTDDSEYIDVDVSEHKDGDDSQHKDGDEYTRSDVYTSEHSDKDESEHNDTDVSEHKAGNELEHTDVYISEHNDTDDSEYIDVDVSEHKDGDDSQHKDGDEYTRSDVYTSEHSDKDESEHNDTDVSEHKAGNELEHTDVYISEHNDTDDTEYIDVDVSEHKDGDDSQHKDGDEYTHSDVYTSEHSDKDESEHNDTDVSEHKAGNESEHTDVYISEHNDTDDTEYNDVDVSEHKDGDDSQHKDGDEYTRSDVYTSEHSDKDESEHNDTDVFEHKAGDESEHTDVYISEHNDKDESEHKAGNISEHKAGDESEHTDVYISEHNETDDSRHYQPINEVYHSHSTAHYEPLLREMQSLCHEDHTSGIQNEPEKTRDVLAIWSPLSKSLPAFEEAKHDGSSEPNSLDKFHVEQSLKKSPPEAFKESDIWDSLDSDKNSFYMSSYHPPPQLKLPRSAYTLHQLKVLEHERKKMSGKLQDPGKTIKESTGHGTFKDQSAFGLQEMAERFLQMKSPNIDTVTGITNRHMHLQHIQNYLTEIRNKLQVSKNDKTSSLSYSQSDNPSHLQTAPLFSLGHSKPCQIDLGPVYDQTRDAKGVKVLVHPLTKQRAHFPCKQRKRLIPFSIHQENDPVVQSAGMAFTHGSFPGGQIFHAREEQGHAYDAITSNKERTVHAAFDHRKLYQRQVCRHTIPYTAHQMIHPSHKPLSHGHLCAEVPKPSGDPTSCGRFPKHCNNEMCCAHDPRLCVLPDKARTKAVIPEAERNGHLPEQTSFQSMYDPTASHGLDARVLDKCKADYSHRFIPAETRTAVPQCLGVLPGHGRMPYTNTFSKNCANAENVDMSDKSSSLSSTCRFGTIGSGSRCQTRECSKQTSINGGMLERGKYDLNSRDTITVDARPSHYTSLPGRDYNFERDWYQGKYQMWSNRQADYPSKMVSAHQNPNSDVYRAQQSYQRMNPCSHNFPKVLATQGRPGVIYNPFPHYLYSASDLAMAKSHSVHYQHESAKFDSSLKSSPAIPSSTDSSSFHSSPELSLDVDAVKESTTQQSLKTEAPNMHKPWDGSLGVTESALDFTSSSGVHFTPVKTNANLECKWNGSTDTCTCETEAKPPVFSMKKLDTGTTKTASSLSEAFERFLGSDVDPTKDICASDEEFCWGNVESYRRLKQKPTDSSFSAYASEEQPKSTVDLLWVDTKDHSPTCHLSEFSCCAGLPIHRTCHHAPLLKQSSHLWCQNSSDWENGNGSKPSLSMAFDRFLDMSPGDVPEFLTAESSRPDSHQNLAKSTKPSKATDSCDQQQQTRVYDLNDVVRVVLEMGVIHPENHSEFEAAASSDNLQFPHTLDKSAYRCRSTETDDCCMTSDSLHKHCPSSSSGSSQLPTPTKLCTPVFVRESLKIKESHGKPRVRKHSINSFHANIEKDQSSSNNEGNHISVSKSCHKSERHPRRGTISKLRGKSAGGSTLSSQKSSDGSSSALHRSGSQPPKKQEAEHTSRRKSVPSWHNSRLGQTCLPESRPSIPRGASCNVTGDQFPLSSCDCHHLDNRQSCCHNVAMPFVLPWNNGAPYPFCSPMYCMHSQVQNPSLGFYPPFLPAQQCPHGCMCKHFTGCHHANPNLHAIPSFILPEMHQHCVMADQHLLSSELSSRELDNSMIESNNNDRWNQQACVATVDAVDTSVVPTLHDMGIVQVLLSDRQEEARSAPKPSSGTADPHHEHCSSGTASRNGIYTKNKQTKRTKKANRYTKRGKDKSGEGHHRRQKTACLLPPSGEDTESREAKSHRSTSSLKKREKGMGRMLQSQGPSATDSGSEKSDREICYVTVPVDIRIRLEKAAKWISTQLFVCPRVRLLTPRDAHIFSIQQNLHLTQQIMTLND